MAFQHPLFDLHVLGESNELPADRAHILEGFDACGCNSALCLDQHISDHGADPIAHEGLLSALPVEVRVPGFDFPPAPGNERDGEQLIQIQDSGPQSIVDVMTEAAGPLLQTIELFDVYTGENVGENEKSFAFSLRYQNKERTLVDEEITTAQQRVVDAVKETFNAELRA